VSASTLSQDILYPNIGTSDRVMVTRVMSGDNADMRNGDALKHTQTLLTQVAAETSTLPTAECKLPQTLTLTLPIHISRISEVTVVLFAVRDSDRALYYLYMMYC
jgi:hypothetical protein